MYKALDQSVRDSDKLSEISDFAYRVWAQGLATSDMTGRITGSPKKFWAHAMPLVEYNAAKVALAIKELTDKRLVHSYVVDDKTYLVYHEHDEHNKGARNLRNLHPQCPPPPPGLCYCVTYAPGEEIDENPRSADGSVGGSADGTAGVPLLSSPVPVPVLSQEGVQGEDKDSAPEEDAWLFGMVKVLQARGCPNKAPTIRTWANTIGKKLGRQRAEELFRFGKVANMTVIEIYDANCKEVSGGNGKQPAPGARATGKFSLQPGDLDKKLG
jgi:hypothetical protein